MEPAEQPVRAYLFGQFRLLADSEVIVFSTRKSACLFSFLLLNRGKSIPRERLWSSLWGDLDEERARRNLSTALWRVRRETSRVHGIQFHVTKSVIKLHSIDSYVDVEDFDRRLKEAETADVSSRKLLLEEAEALYSGDFLEGFPEDWCEEERRDLRRSYVQLLKRLADVLVLSSDYKRASSYLERLIRIDPLDEEAHRDLMRVYHVLGKRSAALAQFAHLRQILSDELGVEPSDSTLQLFDHIRIQSSWVLPDDTQQGVMSGRIGDHRIFGEVPLVGRSDEVRLILQRLDLAAQSNGGGILLLGDLGIGKSKLIQTVTAEAKLRGFDVLRGGCPDLESPPPYQVFVQAVWPRVIERPRGNDKFSVVIEHLVRALWLSPPQLRNQRQRIELMDNAMLNEWMLSILNENSSSNPTLLVLEDVHRIDSASHRLLLTLLGRLPALRLLVLSSVRSGEPRTQEVMESLATNGMEVMRLQPLDAHDVSKLIEGALGRVMSLNRLVRFAWERTGGVPLFVIELLKFLLAEHCLKKVSETVFVLEESRLASLGAVVPSQVLEVIERRIQRLDPSARNILSTAAVIGFQVSLELLEQLLGVPEDEFVGSIEHLVDARLLAETSNYMTFPHESIRLAALRNLSGIRLKRLHAKAAAVLERLVPSRRSDIAWHYSEAGNMEKALHYFEASGDDARLVHANEDASRWYTRALEALASSRLKDSRVMRRKAVLLLKRQESLDLTGDRAQQSRDIEEVLQIAGVLGDNNLLAQGMFHRSQVLSRINLNREALAAGLGSERLFMGSGDIKGAARAAEAVGLAFMNLRNQNKARRAFKRSLLLFRRAPERAGEARALVNLGTVIAFAGSNPEGMEHLDQGENILRQLDDKRSLAGALLQKGVLSRCMGQSLQSESLLLNGVGLMREIGDKIGEARGLSQLAATRVTLGKLRYALHESLRAMRLAQDAKDIRAQIVFLNNAAYAVFRCIGDFKRAEKCVTRAIHLVAEAGPLENSAIYYDTMASILLEKRDYESALRWARQARALYRSWEGHFNFVGNDIDFHLGLAYLRTKQLDRAGPLLLRAVANWARSSDIELEIHGLTALAEFYLERREYTHALECVRKVEKLLRKTDGLEQIQKVYWIQFRVFQSVGADAAAKRALLRAHSAVLSQADALKGRFRRRFLDLVSVNKLILRQVEVSALIRKGSERVAGGRMVSGDPAIRIAERRRALLALVTARELRQKEIAARLGVSVRTVRCDLMALRNQGVVDRGMLRSARG